MKKTIISVSVILTAVSLVFLFFNIDKRESENFNRNRFFAPETVVKDDYNEKIPGFKKIKYKDGDRIQVTPGIEGDKGILLSLRIVKNRGVRGRISIKILRKGNVVFKKSAEFNKKTFNFKLSKKFCFLKSDIFEISFSGSGEAIVRDPVFYSIIEPDERKYVFVIALDNLRYDRIGRVVNGVDLTPNLNGLKKDSVNFINGYSQSSWTLPAFTSLFTGLYEFNHGITRESTLAGDIPLLTENLSSKYVTISLNGGAWLGPGITEHRGFDLFKLGSRAKDVDAAKKFFKNSIRFLEENEIPNLFMFMHTFSIHAPYFPPEKFLFEIENKPKYKFLKALTHNKQFKSDVPEEKKLGMELLYDADVRAFDFYFGKFVEYLKRKNIYKRSTIVFLSDHGEEFFEHGGWFHGHSHYDEMIRIPIIIKFPDNQYQGSEIKDLAGVIDILPTLGEFLGVDTKADTDGISLMPLIKGGNLSGRVLISSTTKCQIGKRSPEIVAILKGKYKYLYNIDNVNRKGKKKVWETILNRGKYELYDLMADPGELHNLWTKKPDLVGMFMKKLREIMKKVKNNYNSGITKKTVFTETDKEKLKTLGYL